MALGGGEPVPGSGVCSAGLYKSTHDGRRLINSGVNISVLFISARRGGAALPFFDVGLVWSESVSANLEKVEATESSGGRDESSSGDHGSPGGVCCALRLEPG